MPGVATYRCPKCKTEYRLLDAGARRFVCCGVLLERKAEVRRMKDEKVHTSAFRLLPFVVEVIPPRENSVDALAVETLLGSLATESLFSLEIAGDAKGRHFLIRAPKETLAHIQRQVQAVYDQVDFREMPAAEDPAARNGLPTAMAQMTLRRPVYLPLRTYRDGDFREADPVRGLLGAFGDFEEGERALAQIVLSPAPPHWADRYQGSTYRIDQSFASLRTGSLTYGAPMTGSTLLRQFAVIGAVMITLTIGLWALFAFLRHDWLSFLLAAVLFA